MLVTSPALAGPSSRAPAPGPRYVPVEPILSALRLDRARFQVLVSLTSPGLPRIRSRTGQRAGAGVVAYECGDLIDWLERVLSSFTSTQRDAIRAASLTEAEFHDACREQAAAVSA